MLLSANISGQDPIDISEANKYFPLVKNVYDSLAEVTNKLLILYFYILYIKMHINING